MQFHIEFERMSPEAHQDFLESLGIEKNEVSLIRNMSIKTTTKSNNATPTDAKNFAAD